MYRTGCYRDQFLPNRPGVLDYFQDSYKIRFMFETKGVFHPKVYLFCSANRWEALVGSANLTTAALESNAEAMLWITGSRPEAGDLSGNLSTMIDEYWQEARTVDEETAARYRRLYAQKRPLRYQLEGRYGTGAASRPEIDSAVMTLSWTEYFERVQRDPYHDFEGRCGLLERVCSGFREFSSFQAMPLWLRQAVAGLPNDDEERLALVWEYERQRLLQASRQNQQ